MACNCKKKPKPSTPPPTSNKVLIRENKEYNTVLDKLKEMMK